MKRENNNELCKNVFKIKDPKNDLGGSLTRKWIELINYLENLYYKNPEK
jgi:hypothetical protein